MLWIYRFKLKKNERRNRDVRASSYSSNSSFLLLPTGQDFSLKALNLSYLGEKEKTPPKLLGFLPRLLFAAGRNVEVLLPLEYLRLSGANRTFE